MMNILSLENFCYSAKRTCRIMYYKYKNVIHMEKYEKTIEKNVSQRKVTKKLLIL